MNAHFLIPLFSLLCLAGCYTDSTPSAIAEQYKLTIHSNNVDVSHPERIKPNTDVTMDLTPKPGFTLSSAYVNGEKVEIKNNQLIIKNIASDISIHVIAIPDSELPTIYIDTNNSAPILNKTDYVESKVSILNRTSEADLITAIAGVRLRGNTTMLFPKKPYRIKFDEKQGMFGRPEFKNWVLLADYNDLSHVKNFTAYSLAEKLDGMHFSPLAVHVNVYLNNEYQGIYLLSDQVQENEGRASVETKIKETDLEVPFLVELDEYASSEGDLDIDYFTINTRHFAIKYPEADDRKNNAQFEYIKSYITNVDTSIRADSNWDELIDIDSFIDFYIVQELMGQGEINWKSVYMSKSKSGKLKMGPVWDFDWSSGGPISHFSSNPPKNWKLTGWFSSDNWFAALLQSKRFTDNLKVRWADVSTLIDAHLNYVSEYKDHIEKDAKNDHIKWERFIASNNPLLTFDGQYEYVLEYLTNRKIWMESAIQALNPEE